VKSPARQEIFPASFQLHCLLPLSLIQFITSSKTNLTPLKQ
jgi:hypothetical protein